jgi:RNA polymerase sigma-70 factor (ECF subfamily)
MTSFELGADAADLLPPSDGALPTLGSRSASDDARLRTMVDAHFDFAWRCLRRLGVPPEQVDDAAQQVWWVVARKLSSIAPEAERSFLFGTALRVASDLRRARGRRPEIASDVIDEVPTDALDAEELLDQRRAREVLDEVLDDMTEELRVVFLLVELEETSLPVVARILDVPLGTATSRLRRARAEFAAIVKRRSARAARGAR